MKLIHLLLSFLLYPISGYAYSHLSPYSYCGGDPINRVDPDGCDFWYTNNVTEITNFYNAILADNHTFDFSSWDHFSDIEFFRGLVFDDSAFKFYATTSSVENGIFTVTCRIYTLDFPIYPFPTGLRTSQWIA